MFLFPSLPLTAPEVSASESDEVVRLILHHYESLDSKYRGVIPLKRVYVPQAIDDDSDTT